VLRGGGSGAGAADDGEESVAKEGVWGRSRGCRDLLEVAGKCGELRGEMVQVGDEV
jgi:hypothetical protein